MPTTINVKSDTKSRFDREKRRLELARNEDIPQWQFLELLLEDADVDRLVESAEEPTP